MILCSKSYKIAITNSLYSNFKLGKEKELTQILIELPVAAHNQYLFGEKQRALMLSPLSKVYKCLLSFKSQSIAWPSLPPEAHREPSGETVTVFK